MPVTQLSLFEPEQQSDDSNYWLEMFGFEVKVCTIGRLDNVICDMENGERQYAFCMEVEVIEIIGEKVRCIPTREWMRKVPWQPDCVYITELKNIAPIFT